MNMLLTMSSIIFPIITFPYVSRILLPVGTGRVSFATSVVAYFAMFAQLGIPTYGISACAKIRDDKEKLTQTVQELFIINMIMSIIAYLVLGIAIFRIERLYRDRVLILIISLTIIFNAIGFEWLYKALEQYTYITIRSVIFKFIALIAMFLLVHEQTDYIYYGAITILASSASNILNFLNIHKYISLAPRKKYNLKRHMKAVMVFFAMSCATTIYTNLDTVMLGFLKTEQEVGYYNAAVKIKSILVSLVTSLGTVLLPRASYYVEKGLKDEFYRITKKALNFVILIATPIFIYFTIYAREGIYFLSGTAYAGSVIPMQIIMPTLLFIGMTNIMGIQMLIPLGKEKYVLYSEIWGAITDLILNWILIPRLGAAGAAIGTVVAEIVVWCVQFHYLKEDVIIIYKQIHYARIIFAILAGSVASLWIKQMACTSFVKLVLSSIVYFGIYFGILLVKRETLVIEILRKVQKIVCR